MNYFHFQRLVRKSRLLLPRLNRFFGNKGSILLLCVLVGVVSGLGAVFLKTMAHKCHLLVFGAAGTLPGAPWIYPALPAR